MNSGSHPSISSCLQNTLQLAVTAVSFFHIWTLVAFTGQINPFPGNAVGLIYHYMWGMEQPRYESIHRSLGYPLRKLLIVTRFKYNDI